MTIERALELLPQMRDSEWITALGKKTALYTDEAKEAFNLAISALEKQEQDGIKSHSEKEILKGCICLMQEIADYFGEYLDFVDFKPETEEEKQPICMSYFHIVNRLFLFHTSHSGGTSTRAKCKELGVDDSSETVKFHFLNEEGEEEEA